MSAETASGDDGLFDRIVEFLQKLFGIEEDGTADDTEVAEVPMAARTESAEIIHLADVVPATEALDETLPDADEDLDDDDAEDDVVYQIAV